MSDDHQARTGWLLWPWRSLLPIRMLERLAGAVKTADGRRHGHHHLQQRQHGRAQGGRSCRTSISIPTSRRSPRSIACCASDRLIGILPLFHSFGYTMFWFAANSGIGTACHPSPLDAAAIGSLVERYRVTVLLATPTFLQLYMRRCTPAQFGSIRLVLAGAEKLPESMALAFEDTFGIRPMEGYGLTECSPVVAVNTFDWREPGFFQPGSRRGYVGPAACPACRCGLSRAKPTSRSDPIARAWCWSRGRT